MALCPEKQSAVRHGRELDLREREATMKPQMGLMRSWDSADNTGRPGLYYPDRVSIYDVQPLTFVRKVPFLTVDVKGAYTSIIGLEIVALAFDKQ